MRVPCLVSTLPTVPRQIRLKSMTKLAPLLRILSSTIRQQSDKVTGKPNLSLADFVAPKGVAEDY